MAAPLYLIDCPKCKAPALKPCVSLTKGKTTDTHAIRVENQFASPDMQTVVRREVNAVYGKFAAEYMPETICKRWLEPGWIQVKASGSDELMQYLWMNTSGGGTAEITARRIRIAVDTWYRNRG